MRRRSIALAHATDDELKSVRKQLNLANAKIAHLSTELQLSQESQSSLLVRLQVANARVRPLNDENARLKAELDVIQRDNQRLRKSVQGMSVRRSSLTDLEEFTVRMDPVTKALQRDLDNANARIESLLSARNTKRRTNCEACLFSWVCEAFLQQTYFRVFFTTPAQSFDSRHE